jgi:hypothetical protein
MREWTAENTFLMVKRKLEVGNDSGTYTLSEFRNELKKDMSSISWFWQKAGTVEIQEVELNDFGARYTHVRKATVYSALVEEVLSDRLFAARESALLVNGVLSQPTECLISQLISKTKEYQYYAQDMEMLADTRCHLMNQVHLRGLRAVSMKTKTPGNTTATYFRPRARTMESSPRASRSKSDLLMPSSTPCTVTMKGSGASTLG